MIVTQQRFNAPQRQAFGTTIWDGGRDIPPSRLQKTIKFVKAEKKTLSLYAAALGLIGAMTPGVIRDEKFRQQELQKYKAQITDSLHLHANHAKAAKTATHIK